jgi:hypothetical protein
MSDRFKGLLAHLGLGAVTGGITIAGAGDGGAATELTAENFEAALAAAEEQGRAAGFAAANARVLAVMSSDAGKANPAGALAMVTDPDMAAIPADKLSAKISSFGVPAKEEPVATGAQTEAAKKIEAATPPVNVLTGLPSGQTADGDEKGSKEASKAMQDDVLASVNASTSSSGFLPGARFN